MHKAHDQLDEETTYPHLAAFLRSGGTLEVGEDFSHGAFARIRKGNKTIVVDAAYRDLAAVLMEMEARARDFLNRVHEYLDPP